MDERTGGPQRLVLGGAHVLPLLAQRPGLLPVISDPGLTSVLRGRHNEQPTLSPYPCPIICNCDRWKPGRDACDEGQRQWKDQGREKGSASGLQNQVISEFWMRKADKPFFALPIQAELLVWGHGCLGWSLAIYAQSTVDSSSCLREKGSGQCLPTFPGVLWALPVWAGQLKPPIFDLQTTLSASRSVTLPPRLTALLSCFSWVFQGIWLATSKMCMEKAMSENSHNDLEIEQRKGSRSTTCQDTLPSSMNLNNVVLALVQTKRTMTRPRIQKQVSLWGHLIVKRVVFNHGRKEG